MLRPEKLSDLVGGGQRGSGPGWCTAPGARLCLSSHCRGQGLRALARNCPRLCVYTTEIGKHCKSVLCFLSPSVLASTGGSSGKEPACQCRRRKRCGFDPWVGTIPWRRARQPSAVFLPGQFHGQRSLAGYSPWGHKESDMTEHTQYMYMYTHIHVCMYICEICK